MIASPRAQGVALRSQRNEQSIRLALQASAVMAGCFLGLFSQAIAADQVHPLLPGLRSAELNNPAWPRTLHDNLATGFSPLVCGMSGPPKIWASVELGGTEDWVYVLQEENTGDRLLVSDGRLRLITWDGEVRWTSGAPGSPIFYGDLGGRKALLFSGGPRLAVIDPQTGKTVWSHTFEPAHVQVRAQVADILPEKPGLEVAVIQSHGEDGCVISFPPEGEPFFVWQRKVVVPGEFDERYDHYCDLRVDLSVPEQPVIWNVRRHRCRGFDARSGQRISTLEYEIGGQQRRNYGPWDLGRGNTGNPLVAVVGERVQLHVHGIRLNRQGRNELAWQHYYGEVYKGAFGVAIEPLAITDLDGDGATEIAYAVRDPAHDFRSFVRVRDAETGVMQWELTDYWGVASFSDLGADKVSGLIVCAAPNGLMPKLGNLEIYRFQSGTEPAKLREISHGRLWGPTTLVENGHNLLLLREDGEVTTACLTLYDVTEGKLLPLAQTQAKGLLQGPVRAVLRDETNTLAEARFVIPDADGNLAAWSWNGHKHWELDLQGGSPPAMSAADLDSDGRAELVAVTPGRRVRIFTFDKDGTATTRANHEHVARWHSHSPLLYDLHGDGHWCLVAPARAADGRLDIRAYGPDDTLQWKTTLDVPADDLVAFVAHAGKYLPGGRAAVAVSIRDSRLTREGTYLLDGPTGELRWFKGLYENDGIVMPYRAHGVPTAYDFDGDGTQELGIDMLSYMAYLRGEDGSFVYINHSNNIRAQGANYAGRLYNTYCPIFRKLDDRQPHWLVNGGFGPFGVMHPGVETGIWRVDLSYDVPPTIGMVDVDGDDQTEVGYAALYSNEFVCRDLWTGDVEWQLELPHAPNAPCLSADVDGDGKGEFLIGSFCVGTDDQGQGVLRWQSPAPLGWGVIADFDGDGRGEIACARRGEIVLLNEP